MSKKVNFYSPADESEILKAYNTLSGKARKDALTAIAKRLGRNYSSVYVKALNLAGRTKISKATKVHKAVKAAKKYMKKVSPAKVAKVTGSTIRFPYRSIEIDAATQEIVVKL